MDDDCRACWGRLRCVCNDCDVCGRHRDYECDCYDEDDYDHDDEDAAWEWGHDRRANHGTAACDGTCVPACSWCLVAHACPDECGGREDCPYRAMERESAGGREQ